MSQAMNLSDTEIQTVIKSVLIWDVTGEQLRLVANLDGNIVPTPFADTVIALFHDEQPSVITFDPSVSFGASEGMVNDNEQAIITACRKIVRKLDCCVRMVAHTGKSNARQVTLDQYTSRGGSALPDGSRMVAVLQPWKPGDKNNTPPADCAIDESSTFTILSRPKLSYAPGNLPNIWIKRTGWSFEASTEIRQTPEEKQTALFEQIILFLKAEIKAGHRHGKTSFIEALIKLPNIKREDARSAYELLISHGRIVELELPETEQKTRRKTFLAPAGFSNIPKKESEDAAKKSALNNAADYRKNIGGNISRPNISQISNVAGNIRQDSAELAGLNDNKAQ